MVSVIITTKKEPKTLSRAIQSILNQNLKQEYEILIIGPDKETQEIVKNFSQYSRVEYLKDQGQGKPAALNLGFQKAKGNVLVLTDGDVEVGHNALNTLLKPFQDHKVGAVTGQPVSISPKDTLFGFWSHFLTNAAHQWRLKSGNFPCSGYLYAFRDIIKRIPDDIFAEDGIITQMIREKGYKIVYAPEAEVFVKYPDNFKDWLKQKVRSTGGYVQKQSRGERNVLQEIASGLKLFFTYPKNFKEYWWTILLYLARLYLWLKIFWRIKIRKEEFKNVWQRIESTK